MDDAERQLPLYVEAETMKLALLQTNPQDDRQANLERAADLIQEAATSGAEVIVLPEMFSYMGPDEQRLAEASEIGAGDFAWLAGLARQHGVVLVGGSVGERPLQDAHSDSNARRRVFNTHQTFGASGSVLYTYRKLHLFNLRSASGGQSEFRESDWCRPGEAPKSCFEIQVHGETWKALTLICYDLRFPEIFRHAALRNTPPEIVFLPSAFTHRTGKSHWEVLVRARAIENQCYVAACNQTGSFNGGQKRNYGHSMVVSPWGEIVSACGESEGILYADVSLEEVHRIRKMLPSLDNRVL